MAVMTAVWTEDGCVFLVPPHGQVAVLKASWPMPLPRQQAVTVTARQLCPSLSEAWELPRPPPLGIVPPRREKHKAHAATSGDSPAELSATNQHALPALGASSDRLPAQFSPGGCSLI